MARFRRYVTVLLTSTIWIASVGIVVHAQELQGVSRDTIGARTDTSRGNAIASQQTTADDAPMVTRDEVLWDAEIIRWARYIFVGGTIALAAFAGTFIVMLIRGLSRGYSPEIASHWGGFGGGVGGWRISPTIVYLIGALFFGSLLALVVHRTLNFIERAGHSTPSAVQPPDTTRR